MDTPIDMAEIMRNVDRFFQIEPMAPSLQGYLKAMAKYQEEFSYAPPTDSLLATENGITDTRKLFIDMTVAYPRMDLPKEVKARALEFLKTSMDQIFGDDFSATKEKINYIDNALEMMVGLVMLYRTVQDSPELSEKLPLEQARAALANLLSFFTYEQISIITKNEDLNDLMKSDLVSFYFPDKEPEKFPILKSEVPRITKDYVSLTLFLCEALMKGIENENGVIRQSLGADKRELQEKGLRNFPKEGVAEQRVDELFKNQLLPLVIKWMDELQGIKEVEPENVFVCEGSSGFIIHQVLFTLKVEEVDLGKLSEKKSVLIFGRSWDGYKKHVAPEMFKTGVIDGSVSASALEEYILKEVLGIDGSKPFDIVEAREKVHQKVAALMINIPENPNGINPSEQEMIALAAVISKYDIPFVISDEIFALPNFRSISTYPDMAQRTYVTSSTSKIVPVDQTLSFGYSQNTAFAQELLNQIANTGRVPLEPESCAGFISILRDLDVDYFNANQALYAENRQTINKEMAALNSKYGLENGISWLREPNYGCLGVITFPRSLTDAANIRNSAELAEYLYKTCAVAGLPSGDVYAESSQDDIGIRINFSGNIKVVEQAIQRMAYAIQSINQGITFDSIAGNKSRGAQTSNKGAIDDALMTALKEVFSADAAKAAEK